MGKEQSNLQNALQRLEHAIDQLEHQTNEYQKQKLLFEQSEIEIQNLNMDRALLAKHIDETEAKAQKILTNNKKASRHLVKIMEMLRILLTRETSDKESLKK